MTSDCGSGRSLSPPWLTLNPSMYSPLNLGIGDPEKIGLISDIMPLMQEDWFY